MKRTSIIIIGLSAIMRMITVCHAQTISSAEQKANILFENFAYSKAIEAYLAIEPRNTHLNRRLAECYNYIGDSENAEKFYALVIKAGDHVPDDLFNYAQVLKQNSNYPKAMEWMSKYNEWVPGDRRAESHLKDPKYYVTLLKKDKDKYQIANLNMNSTETDFAPSFYKDKIVFASARESVQPIKRTYNWDESSFLDLYISDKQQQGALKEPVEFDQTINGKFHDGPAAFSEDGKLMVVTRNNYAKKSSTGVMNLELVYMEKTEDTWGNEKIFDFNSEEYSVGHPSLTPDGKTLYFSSNMPGGKGGTDIYKVTRLSDTTWSKPENLGEKINTEGDEMFPFIHVDGMLFFSSNGHAGLGGLDVFIAIPSRKKSFSKIVNMGYPLNDSKDDFALIVDKDMKKGYFSSNRPGGKGDDDIYSFKILKPFIFGKSIIGIAKDKQDNILPVTTVKLMDEEGIEFDSVITGSDGAYSFLVDPDNSYKLSGNKKDFLEATCKATTFGQEDLVIANLVLEKDPGLSLYCLITEKETKLPLEGVKIKLVNNITGKEEKITTPSTGDFTKALIENKLDDRISYNLYLEMEGYLSKTVTYNKKLDKLGQYNIHELLDVSLDKIAVGGDLAKIIDIKPIYFDLAKYTIRSDAAIELDKIVKVMNENPNMIIELGSHTDCRSSAASNEKLSQKRAVASAEYVKKKITNPERIYGKGYGESRLVNGCACEGTVKSPCTESEHQTNRRTEFIIIKM